MIPIPLPRGSFGGRGDLGALLAMVGGLLILVQTLLFGYAALDLLGGLVTGVGIVGLGAAVRGRPGRSTAVGAGILLLGASSIFLVSGFFVGALLAILGGIVVLSVPSYRFQNPRSALFTPAALGPPCPRCGRPIPTWTSTCPYCGFPDRSES